MRSRASTASTPIRWCRPWPRKPYRRLGASLPRVVQNPRDLAARTDALYGAWLAANFRAEVGLEHAIAQRVRQWFNLDHAHTHAIATPYAIGFNSAAAPEAMARIKRALGVGRRRPRPLRSQCAARPADRAEGSRHARGGSRQGRRGGEQPSRSPTRGRSPKPTSPRSSARRISANRRDFESTMGGAKMQNKFRGVMQSPVTPLKDDFSLDLPTFERLLDFHVRAGAPAISWPHHKGESLNLTIPSASCSPKPPSRSWPAACRSPSMSQRARGRRHDGAGAARAGHRRRRHSGDHAVFLDADARSDRGLFHAAVHLDRPASAVLQLAELSHRRRDHRRSDGAADRKAAELRRRQGSKLQQREVLGDFARGVGACGRISPC